MRVVGGEFRGRTLAAPKSSAIRPTADRTREALFNILGHGHADRLPGARVLDLFSGTGALGIEALSRGAAFCLFVEMSAEGRALVRRNLEAVGAEGRAKIFRRDATRLGPVGAMPPFDLIFADPPYGKGLGQAALRSALEGGWLAAGCLCVLEEAADAPFETGPAFAIEEERRYGDTLIRILRSPCVRSDAQRTI
jgi:16S rRNA (guanine966-N2)-methyltransferase